MKLTESKTILVTFLMQLGDLILTTPFITALRRAAPHAKITYLMDRRWHDILVGNPDIDEILTIDRKGDDKGSLALWRYSAQLRQKHFDFLINLNPSERCSFLAAFSGAKYKTGATPRLFKPFFDKPLVLNRQIHAADMYLDILKQLGVEHISHDGLKILPAHEHEEQAARFFSGHHIIDTDKLIGFNIGSASATKCWLPERFAQVADQLADDGYKIVFLGSSSESDMVHSAVQFMKTKPIIATGQFSVGALVAVIKRLNLLITNDSGPMHIGVSQKVPLVALFGPSKPELYGPYQAEQVRVVKAEPPCTGCDERMKHQCTDMSCMTYLTVEQVVGAARELLAKGNA